MLRHVCRSVMTAVQRLSHSEILDVRRFDPQIQKTKRNETGTRNFPFKLWAAINLDRGVFSWSLDGTRVVVNDERFENEVTTSYPYLVRIASFLNFRRQLREYSFGWCSKDGGNYEFYHPMFHRNSTKKELERIITRRKERMAMEANDEMLDIVPKPDFPLPSGRNGVMKLPKSYRMNSLAQPHPVYLQQVIPDKNSMNKNVYVIARPLPVDNSMDMPNSTYMTVPRTTQVFPHAVSVMPEPPLLQVQRPPLMVHKSGDDMFQAIDQPSPEPESSSSERHQVVRPQPTRVDVQNGYTEVGVGSGVPNFEPEETSSQEDGHPVDEPCEHFSYQQPSPKRMNLDLGPENYNESNDAWMTQSSSNDGYYQGLGHPPRMSYDNSMYSMANSSCLSGASVQASYSQSQCWQPYPQGFVNNVPMFPPCFPPVPAPPPSMPGSNDVLSTPIIPPVISIGHDSNRGSYGPVSNQPIPQSRSSYTPVVYAWLPIQGALTANPVTENIDSGVHQPVQATEATACECPMDEIDMDSQAKADGVVVDILPGADTADVTATENKTAENKTDAE